MPTAQPPISGPTPPIARRRTRRGWPSAAWSRASTARSCRGGRWRQERGGPMRANWPCAQRSNTSLPGRRGRWRWRCAPSASQGRGHVSDSCSDTSPRTLIQVLAPHSISRRCKLPTPGASGRPVGSTVVHRRCGGRGGGAGGFGAAAGGGDARSSVTSVSGSGRPVCGRLRCCWNAFSASRVCSPKFPVASAFSRRNSRSRV